jgi:hypothetical protein
MAFVATENFDSYANGDNISGKTGGSGWTTAWTNGDPGSVTNAQAQSGTLSLLTGAGTNPSRDMTNVTIGSQDSWFYVNTDTGLVRYYNSGNLLIAIRTSSGNVEAYDGSDYNVVAAFTNNTWFKVTIELDQTNQAYKYRTSVNGGTPTAWMSRNLDVTATGVDRWLTFEGFYSDTIEPSAAASAIKTINGLVKASVKTVNSLAIASVKNWNGLA